MHSSQDQEATEAFARTLGSTMAPAFDRSDDAGVAPGTELGPYRVMRLLGSGGMGVVMLAQQREPVRRDVAIKLLRQRLGSGLDGAYFEVERQALARMRHPGIAQIFDAGTTPEGHPYFVMEYVDGPSLNAWCQEHSSDLRERVRLLQRVCLAAHHAHQRGVIHRDLKPSNVLVSDVDGQAQAKIIDFGVAIGIGGGRQERAGTPQYMSPEQANPGAGIDIRTDVYALGVMLLKLVAEASAVRATSNDVLPTTARSIAPSLTGDAFTDALAAGRERVQTLLSEPTLPLPLRWIATRATAAQAADRYDSAAALADDLGRWLRDEPLAAAPPSRRYRTALWLRRHRAACAAGVAIFLAACVGVGALAWSLQHARLARENAEREARRASTVATFLKDVLAGATPETARQLDKTLLRKVLDSAADRAGKQLADSPDVLAEVMATVARSYGALADFKPAEARYREAIALSEKAAGASSPQTIDLLYGLAQLFNDARRAKEALALCDDALARLGPNGRDDERLRLRATRTAALWLQGDIAAALKEAQAVYAARLQRDGADADATITAENLVGIALSESGDHATALRLQRQVYDWRVRRFGEDHPETLGVANSVAIELVENNDFPAAIAMLEKIIPLDEKVYGADSVYVLRPLNTLASVYRKHGDMDKARPVFERALALSIKLFGDAHANTLVVRHNLGNFYLEAGEFDAAAAQQEIAVAGSDAAFGAGRPERAEFLKALAKVRLKQGRKTEARAVLDQARALLEANHMLEEPSGKELIELESQAR